MDIGIVGVYIKCILTAAGCSTFRETTTNALYILFYRFECGASGILHIYDGRFTGAGAESPQSAHITLKRHSIYVACWTTFIPDVRETPEAVEGQHPDV